MLNGEAAVLPVVCQQVSRVSVIKVSHEVIASFYLDTKMGLEACFSQNITKGVTQCHNITPTLTSDGRMSKSDGKMSRRRNTCGHLGHTTGELHEIMMEVWYMQDGHQHIQWENPGLKLGLQ